MFNLLFKSQPQIKERIRRVPKIRRNKHKMYRKIIKIGRVI